MRDGVAAVLEDLRALEQRIQQSYGIVLDGKRMLDVGPGQLLAQQRYFALRNDVVGIDLDLVVHGFDLRGYAAVLRTNGAKRLAKTMARKALLIDLRYARELARQLGVTHLPRTRMLQMDAAHMTFDDESFDATYAFAVFQHLPEPGAVLKEMVRVLRPGGVLYLDFVLYTSSGGSHDVRLLGGRGDSLPPWIHLRPESGLTVQPNAFLNMIRLGDWRRLFEQELPGATVQLEQPNAERLAAEATDLQAAGDLSGYSLEELLTNKVSVLWQKPPAAAT